MVAVVAPRDAHRLKGFAAGIRLLHQDHTAFWQEAAKKYPDDLRFVRGTIHAALRSGKTELAETGVDFLIERSMAAASDSEAIIGLTRIDQSRCDDAKIRHRIRRFLRSLRGDRGYRFAALRLSRLIYAYFPRRSAPAANHNGQIRRQFLNMMEHAGLARETAALLRRVASVEERLENLPVPAFLDTDISSEQCRAFVGLVRSRLSEGQPFSFVRIGDGEAACLPYEPRLATLAMADAKDRERIWWGEPLRHAEREWLAPRVAHAIWSADCIGIPTIARFVRELKLSQRDSLESNLTGRGLRSILYCVERLQELRPALLPLPAFTSCHLHQELALWNLYGELFDGGMEVVLVTCHPGAADWVGKTFGLRVVANLLMPPDEVTGPVLPARHGDRRPLPQVLQEVAEAMGDLPRQRLVLVGAGYPGKWLIEVARSRGGVALDLGSVFDHWLGFRTRSYLDLNTA
jgi:hypothetical protein